MHYLTLDFGGLTVLQKINELLPNENIIYFGDTARVPYGSKSKETIIKYSREIVNFLKDKDVKLIIIACGTASSLAYDTLIKEFDIPIINVITPTCKTLKSNKVGVIATKATIKSNAWENEIKKYHPETVIYSKACPLFVPIVEEGLAKTKIADDIIELYLDELKKKEIDSLILGCTHYPILINKIKDYMGNKIKVININENCAKEVKNYLTRKKQLNLAKINSAESKNSITKSNSNDRSSKDASKTSNVSSIRSSMVAYVTDDTANFKKNAHVFCNVDFDKVSKVSLDK